MVVDRGTSHKPPKVPASIIPFVLDSVSEARPADQVICRRNLAGTCGKNIAETDSSATEIAWTTGEDSLNCSATPLAFALWQLLSCQTRPMKGRPVRDRGLGGTTHAFCGRVCCSGQLCAIGALKHTRMCERKMMVGMVHFQEGTCMALDGKIAGQ